MPTTTSQQAIAVRALLYARTLRHLRWEQWVYRPIRRLQGLLPVHASGHGYRLGGRFEALAGAVAAWPHLGSADPVSAADEVLAGRFRFLNHAETLPEVDWSRRHVSHLWSYNLHYFDYALDLAAACRATDDRRYADRFVQLARSWIAGNPPGRGDGWEPYPVSLRTVNWAYALLMLGETLDPPAHAEISASLAAQLRVLERRLELHILANHLQKNLKALVVGGLFFSGPAASRWVERGTRLLWRELFEQVLPDGCQYERSPMYHAIALGDFLEVLSLLDAARIPVPAAVRQRIGGMVDAMAVLSRPDGSLHLFNDAAHGIAPERARLDRLACATLGSGIPDSAGLLSLPDAGYCGFADPPSGDRLLVDCGDPGPSYQPGHAHCDLLSYELDLGGRQVVVDSGVSGYECDPLREYVRSTRAHSTVMIGGRDQSEVWGTFRVARRAVPLGAGQELEFDRYAFRGAYAPFHDRRACHQRSIAREVAGAWRVTDLVSGASGARLDSFVHLHPDFSLACEGSAYIARAGRLAVRIEAFGADALSVHRGEDAPVQGWYCPEFGRALPAPVLRLVVHRNDAREFGYTITKVQG